MKKLLIKALESFEYPVFLQGTLGKDETYPESFFTFFNNNTDDGNHYDNKSVSYIWDFDVNFYSTDPDKVDVILVELKEKLKKIGFIVPGKGYDIPTDEPTHTGRGINVFKEER